MKKIPVTQNEFALVDDEDYPYLSQFNWHIKKKSPTRWYAARLVTVGSRQRTVYMHQDIVQSKEIDHEDHNGLNNQRCNLRPCSHVENMANIKKRYNNKSGYKGVHWDKETSKWKVMFKVNKKSIYVGRFDNVEDAARAYDEEAYRHSGKFSCLNFPNKQATEPFWKHSNGQD